ncbi:hypothetical protein [Glycomyces arizonensis]|uniref:hypothetical protein n=1 Tax=Glycomyces arizonensis TaxID=256035 RepID=UPI00041D6D30|nr:hypothetical protein [Glycomyces arizonensis]
MSYPSQPSYTPPYGQPQPPRQNNLWLIGVAVIVVLIIIMTVTLLIIQRSDDSTDTGGGTDPTTSAEADPTTEDEPTTEETTPDDGGDTGGEFAGFTEETCSAYDLATFEDVMGEPVDPSQTYTSASSSGETGTVSCYFYTESYWTVSIYVDVTDDPEFNIGWVEDEQVTQTEDANLEVTDYTAIGDAGYMSISDDPSYQTILIDVAVSNIEISVDTTIDTAQQDTDAAVAMVEDLLNQSYTLFAEYEI